MLKISGASAVALLLATTAAYATDADGYGQDFWSGFYGSAQLGYGWSSNDVDISYSSGVSEIQTVLDTAVSGGLFPEALGGGSNGGFTGGIGAGYNMVSGSFVFGAEADINALATESDRFSADSGATTVQVRPTPGAGTTADDRLDVSARTSGSADWLSTLRLRAGYGWDRTLFYATGGLALGGVDSSTSLDVTFDCQSDCGTGLADETASWKGSSSSTRIGWVAGVGAQFAVTDQLSTKIEYLHYDLGSESYTASPHDLPSDLSGLDTTEAKVKAKIDGSLFRIGVNYRF